MQGLDIITQLQIVAQDCSHEYQTIVMHLCLWVLAVIFIGLLAWAIDIGAHRLFGQFKRLGLINSLIVIGLAIPIIIYGGTKRKTIENAGSDDGLNLCGISVMVTNEVVSAGVTNTWTDIEVHFTGTGITVATPVSVRQSETNNWNELEKINPILVTDMATNVLHFGASGDVSNIKYWWVGEDMPSISVETEGIEITTFVAGAHSVAVSWTCNNPNATEYLVQYRNGPQDSWHTVMTTADTNAIISGFFINRTTQWRIISTYTEGL